MHLFGLKGPWPRGGRRFKACPHGFLLLLGNISSSPFGQHKYFLCDSKTHQQEEEYEEKLALRVLEEEDHGKKKEIEERKASRPCGKSYQRRRLISLFSTHCSSCFFFIFKESPKETSIWREKFKMKTTTIRKKEKDSHQDSAKKIFS